ncbi:hypothetical protein [Gracilimonas tropica]|uniref:hypothetical protein n=1 Tax=Gracilimonas tropica TaxID=454600 RepID=UPI00037B96CB|nr:hypothetical protein [Gracilimonas tropica]
MDLSWMREIDNVEKYLDKDLKLVYENCGIDTVISLLSGVPSIHLYVSKASLNRAQEAYIIENHEMGNAKDLALKLGCSEMRVYQVIKKHLQSKTKNTDQAQLFED